MYGDPDPCSTADKSQSCQSEYIGFTIACVVVCVTGAKTRAEGEASSETQGKSVGSDEKVGRTFSSTGERAPGYRLSPNYFQKFKRIPAPDWAQKMLCIIVLNRRTVSPEFFS